MKKMMWMIVAVLLLSIPAIAGDLSVTGKLGAGVTPTLPFQVGASSFTVLSSGNVGVGVAAPAHKLELVAGTTAAGGIGFGTDTELYRSAASVLSLGSGDSLAMAGTSILTSGRLVQTANGTVTAPAFTFSADTNSGLYSVGNDTMTFTTAGVARMTINAGRVGIGNTAPNSTVQISGSLALPIVTKTAAYTAAIGDCTILGNATTAAFTITLPAAATIAGRVYVLKKIDSSANAVTVDANASETIDGALTVVLSTQWSKVMIQSDGANWQKIQ